MLRRINQLTDYAIHATDGDMGHVKDFYFDDKQWAIRYLIVETGNWLAHRKVLISPLAIATENWDNKTFPARLSMAQVKNSPDIDTDKPVTRQHEEDYLRYYNYSRYWGGAGLWGVGVFPGMNMPGYVNNALPADSRTQEEKYDEARESDERRHANDDVHLRSCAEVIGYGLHASDDDIGHITDMLIDEKTWAIRYLIVETGHWWSGHKVLIAPEWIEGIHWENKDVTVNLTREQIQNAPPYDVDVPLNRSFETATHQHYQRKEYWLHEDDGQKGLVKEN
jgi:uncharacterized protein YrrD